MLCLLLAATAQSVSEVRAGEDRGEVNQTITFQRVLPLGVDSIVLEPGKQTVFLMAAALPEGLEGMRLERVGSERRLFTAEGSPVLHFPRSVEFRVTATARRDDFVELMAHPVPTRAGLNQFLLGLRFRLRVFHGLHNYTIEPEAVRLLGMPADVPYEERIFHVLFEMPTVPIEHRLVLEVLSAEGQRAGRFHLALFW